MWIPACAQSPLPRHRKQYFTSVCEIQSFIEGPFGSVNLTARKQIKMAAGTANQYLLIDVVIHPQRQLKNDRMESSKAERSEQ